MTTKITSANVDNTIPSSTDVDGNNFNISLLGFKIAVNEGLTVFNLADGVVDEFNDESGVDDSEGSNQNYSAVSDNYNNFASKPVSAGFGTESVSEPTGQPDGLGTSTAVSTNDFFSGTLGTFTVPDTVTSVSAYMWGSGGNGGNTKNSGFTGNGGGAGFVTGDISVTPGQTLYVMVSESNVGPGNGAGNTGGGGFPNDRGKSGGGLSYIGQVDGPSVSQSAPSMTPNIYMIAGGGGGGSTSPSNPAAPNHGGGGGGGQQANAGGSYPSTRAQTSANGGNGGGGSQSAGGQGGAPEGRPGTFLKGGTGAPQNGGGGGGGYYGGGSGDNGTPDQQGGGGSSYFGNPNVTSGSTTSAVNRAAANTASPFYPDAIHDPNPSRIDPETGVGDGAKSSNPANTQGPNSGGDGYVLLTGTQGTGSNSASIVSASFTAASEPSTARIVVFEEDIDTPTLNTDIIARVSRDGGTTYSNATLSDAGYVTGSSGQRILTGTVDVSGQPTGTSMRWKLDLANNEIKVHGVSLQWG